MLSGNPFILILGIFAFGIFFYLLRIRASKKQIESYKEPQRMNWSWLWLRFGKNEKEFVSKFHWQKIIFLYKNILNLDYYFTILSNTFSSL